MRGCGRKRSLPGGTEDNREIAWGWIPVDRRELVPGARALWTDLEDCAAGRQSARSVVLQIAVKGTLQHPHCPHIVEKKKENFTPPRPCVSFQKTAFFLFVLFCQLLKLKVSKFVLVFKSCVSPNKTRITNLSARGVFPPLWCSTSVLQKCKRFVLRWLRGPTDCLWSDKTSWRQAFKTRTSLSRVRQS